MKNLILLVGAICAGCCMTHAASELKIKSVTSPDGRNAICLVRTEKALRLEISRDGKFLAAANFAGQRYQGADDAPSASAPVTGIAERTLSGTVRTPVYKRASVNLAGRMAAVSFAGDWSIELVARNDGVAYRLVTAKSGTRRLVSEDLTFDFATEGQTAWVGYNNHAYKGDKLQCSWEAFYAKTDFAGIRDEARNLIYLPYTAEFVREGAWMSITESDLRDFPGLNLGRPAGANVLRAHYAAVPDRTVNTRRAVKVESRKPWIADVAGTRTYPWRVFVLGSTAGALTDADIVYALATPAAETDWSWIRPGYVCWDWWNDWNLQGVGFKPGIDTRTYKYYIDFAAKHGLPYIIMDEGWSEHLNVERIVNSIDLAELVRYGREKKVDIILWCAWAQLVGPGRAEYILSMYADIGIKGFKIDFMDRDDQEIVKFLEEVAAIAAKHRLVVDYHGMYKPTGLERTYPNVLNFEGIHGLENLKWTRNRDMPVNDAQAYFTRLVAGPMDYTPGGMLNMTRAGWRPNNHEPATQGTRCHQMALMTLFFAPLQMLADSPTKYEAAEECAQFMSRVPCVWDESITLAGRPGEYVLCARRKGDAWYVAAIGDWKAREIELDTKFLDGGTWKVESFADAADAAEKPMHYVRKTGETVKAGAKFTLRLAPGGGYTARFSR